LGDVARYGIPIAQLPQHCINAVDAAERTHSRTVILRGDRPVAAIVPMIDHDRIEPPDPAAGGPDPLLAMCGTCRHDTFVESWVVDFAKTMLWHRTSAEPR
jgi:hypothetical protein